MGHEGDAFQFDPQVVPQLHKVFAEALAKVDRQIELAGAGLRVTPWAGDPISDYAGERFNARSLDEPAGALTALRTYREALDTVVGKLTKAVGDYRDNEDDSDASLSRRGEG